MAGEKHFQGMDISPSPHICSSLLPASRPEGCSLGSKTAVHGQLEDGCSQSLALGFLLLGHSTVHHSLPHLPAPVLAFNDFSFTNIPSPDFLGHLTRLEM